MKIKRQSKIIELINNYQIETQADLTKTLRKLGFNVTQATVSRDIKQLKLSKQQLPDGRLCYKIANVDTGQSIEKLLSVFRDCVKGLEYAGNIVVIKTLQGMAMAVAASVEALQLSEIVGCIAGDDTIFCLTKNEDYAFILLEKLGGILC